MFFRDIMTKEATPAPRAEEQHQTPDLNSIPWGGRVGVYVCLGYEEEWARLGEDMGKKPRAIAFFSERTAKHVEKGCPLAKYCKSYGPIPDHIPRALGLGPLCLLPYTLPRALALVFM